MLASVAASFSFSALATNLATSLLLSVVARQLFKPDIPKGPTIEAVTRFVQEPNSPRQVVYGRALLSPRIIHSFNSRGHRFRHGDTPNCYNLFCAVAEHRVDLHGIRFDGVDIFTKAELASIAKDFITGIYPVNYPDGSFPTSEDNPTGKLPSKRREKNGLMNDWGSHGTNSTPVMVVFPKLSGTVDAGHEVAPGDVYERPYIRVVDPTKRDFREQSSVNLLRFGQFFYTPSLFGNNITFPANVQWQVANRFAPFLDGDMHCYGTSTIMFTLPIITNNQTIPAIWPSPPNVLLDVSRPLDSLQLWDPTVRGAPPIDSAWAANNAALCCYDYVVRYTDYGKPVCGHSRIDLDSVAVAAKICHEAGYYYPLEAGEEPEVTEQRSSTIVRRAKWKAEYSFTCDGAFSLDVAPSQILQQMVYSLGGGYIAEESGVLYIHAGSRNAPVLGYDEDEIIENSWSISPVPPRANRAAVLDVSYNDRTGKRQHVAFQHALSEDNLKVTSVELPFINSEPAARRIAFILNSRAWETETISFTLLPDVTVPRINDLITLRLDDLGIAGIYRVIELSENPGIGTTEVVVSSERADLYTLPQPGDFVPAPTPPVRSEEDEVDNLLISDDGDKLLINDAGDHLQIN